MMTNDQINLTDKTVWENYYKGKSTARSVNTFINRYIFDAEIIDALSRYSAGDKKKSILEMGCGGSEWLPYLGKKFNLDINGIDYLEVGCESARQLLDANGIRDYKIYCADFFEFHKSYAERHDLLVSFGVIEHFTPPSKPIEAFQHYLKEDGIIITTCPNTGGFAMSLQKILDEKVYNNHVRFNLSQLGAFHQENGYEIISSAYTGFLSFNNLVFSNFSLAGRLAKIALKLTNAPIVYFFYLLKKLGINIQSSRLSSNMIVIAKKKSSRV